jgi:hypothetical protein
MAEEARQKELMEKIKRHEEKIRQREEIKEKDHREYILAIEE